MHVAFARYHSEATRGPFSYCSYFLHTFYFVVFGGHLTPLNIIIATGHYFFCLGNSILFILSIYFQFAVFIPVANPVDFKSHELKPSTHSEKISKPPPSLCHHSKKAVASSSALNDRKTS